MKFLYAMLATLLALAVGVYTDCRFAGGSVDQCRLIFKQVGDRAMSIIPRAPAN
jgi:hypothetical protein